MKQTYATIEQMQLRKEQLREVIALEDKEIKRLWSQLTLRDDKQSRSGQIASFVSYGVMAYDAVMTLRKLKRSYGSVVSVFKRKRS